MKIIPKVKKFQMGGPMEEAPVEEAPMEAQGAPAEAGHQDPMAMLAQMATQALQNQDCQMAMQVCQAFIQILQLAMGSQGAPVFRNGGYLSYRMRK